MFLRGYRLSPSEDERLLLPFITADTSSQTTAFRKAAEKYRGQPQHHRRQILLDLGSGDGSSLQHFRRLDPNCRWVGLEMADSPEAQAGSAYTECVIYDGWRLPFPSGAFDFVYSRQVFEHVEFPSEVVSEAFRILKPNGAFVGSVSHLEPFHSRSIQNFTPYGFAQLLTRAGFSNIQLEPGIDGLTLILRRPLSRFGLPLAEFCFERESPLNLLLEFLGRLFRFDVRRRTALKLTFCGHFIFSAEKPLPRL